MLVFRRKVLMQTAGDKQQPDETPLIKLYGELTGASEASARGVFTLPFGLQATGEQLGRTWEGFVPNQATQG